LRGRRTANPFMSLGGNMTATLQSIMLCHRGVGGDDQIYWSISAQDANNNITWPTRQPLGECHSLSGVSVISVGDVVFCAFASPDGVLYCARYWKKNGTYQWEAEQMGGNMTDRTPNLLVYGGKIWCIHRGYGDDRLFYTTRSSWGGDAAPWTADIQVGTDYVPHASCGPAAVVTGDGKLRIAYTTSDSSLNSQVMTLSYDGTTWSRTYGMNMQSRSTISIQWYKGTILCVWPMAYGSNQIQTCTLDKVTSSGQDYLDVITGPFANQTYETSDGPTLVQVRHMTDDDFVLYMIYRETAQQARLLYSAWQGAAPIQDSQWVNERVVGQGDQVHNDYYEVGAAPFTYTP